tara:strand:+ start:168 stop:761 length:594 start_codon:yes stop_codon:yes gene_type:complete
MRFSKKEEFLRVKDKKLKKIIDKNGHIVFKPKKDHQFDNLVGIVISQFISTKAANSIFCKIKNQFKTTNLTPINFESLTIDEIKQFGLSTNKAKTIKELTELFLDKQFYDLTKINDEDLNQILLSVFGIGPWSLNMFEIFCIGKFDIFSSKDAGLRLAMNMAGMVPKNSTEEKYDSYASKWYPYKTIACLHLWKMVD